MWVEAIMNSQAYGRVFTGLALTGAILLGSGFLLADVSNKEWPEFVAASGGLMLFLAVISLPLLLIIRTFTWVITGE